MYEILINLPGGAPADFKNTDLFRECMAAGIIPKNGDDQNRIKQGDPGRRNSQIKSSRFHNDGLKENPPESPFSKGDFKDIADSSFPYCDERYHQALIEKDDTPDKPAIPGKSTVFTPLRERGAGGDLVSSVEPAPPERHSPEIFENSLQQALSMELILRIDGMWCTACAWLIEQILKKSKGIIDIRVLFLSDLARVRYLPFETGPDAIIRQIRKLGYRAAPFDENSGKSTEKGELLFRLGVAAILTMNIMMISLVLYYGFIETIEADAIPYLSWPLMLMATPVVFYSGGPMLRRAAAGLRHFTTSMDTLISLGVLSAYGYSLFKMGGNSLHLYFDTAAMLVTLVLLGKFIELSAREKVSSGISALYRLSHRKVRLVMYSGEERWVSPEAVPKGAEFLVESGETVPLDGRMTDGTGLLDLSALTGESKPVRTTPGGEVMAGATVLKGSLHLRAIRPAGESALKQMIELMREALSRRNSVELLADRLTRRLIPLIVCIAAVTATCMILSGHSADEALLRALTVLVITCPCALGIATPLAKVAALESCRARGILIRDAGALEIAHDLDTFFLDKTGTLTEGRFRLRKMITAGITEIELLKKSAAVEARSDHFIALEILRNACEKGMDVSPAERFEMIDGLGVKGTVKGEKVIIGNRLLLALENGQIPEAWEIESRFHEQNGETVVFCMIGSDLRGMLFFGDPIKPGASLLVQELHSRRIQIWLVSGDSPETTRAVALGLGIGDFAGACLPEDKVRLLKRFRKAGKKVGMVGDGVNDAAALAAADVGFSLGAGANLPREASNVTLTSADPLKLIDFLDYSGRTGRIIRQNLFFAFAYNLLGIPLAVSGLLNPFLAVVAMFASSLTVIGNTLRITRFGK